MRRRRESEKGEKFRKDPELKRKQEAKRMRLDLHDKECNKDVYRNIYSANPRKPGAEFLKAGILGYSIPDDFWEESGHFKT